MNIQRFFCGAKYIKYIKYFKENLSCDKFKKGLAVIFQEGLSAFIFKLRNNVNVEKCDCQESVKRYCKWVIEQELSKEEIERQKRYCFNYAPLISVIVPVYNTDLGYLKDMVSSVVQQNYSKWELCLADGSSNNATFDLLKEFEKKDERIRVKKLDKNYGIVGNSNQALNMAKGDYIALLDHDDIIYPNSLYEVVKQLNANPNAEIIYTDEDKVSDLGERKEPIFKPDWSPDLLTTQMYICHLLVIKADLINKIGGFREGVDGAQDYDLMLRLSRETNNIIHIPKILYSWRETESSTSINPGSKPYAHDAGKNALNEYLKEKNGHVDDSEHSFVYDVRYDVSEYDTMVSIIIPMKDHVDLTKQCIDSIENLTEYKNYEIILLDNKSVEEETFEYFLQIKNKYHNIKIAEAKYDFNWSKLNNQGIKEAKGDVFIFLNNDTEILSADWMRRLAENALRPEIGVVGALLCYDDLTIQHAGVVVGMGGWADHIFKGMKTIHRGSPFVSPMVRRNVLAVTGACMAISRNTMEKIGGFNEDFIICGSDVEICLRAYKNGLWNLYLPEVNLIHYESKSRDSYIPEIDFELSKKYYRTFWKSGDPFFNVNLDYMSVVPRVKIS